MPAGIATPNPRIAVAVARPVSRPDCVVERAAGKTVVHRGRDANDARDLAAAPGPQRTADDRDDAGAGGYGVAPGAREREHDVTRTRLGVGDRRSRHVDGGRACAAPRCPRQDPSRRASASTGSALADPDAQSVLASDGASGRDDGVGAVHDAAGRAFGAEHLDDGGGAGRGQISELVRESGESVVRHACDSDSRGQRRGSPGWGGENP